MPPRGRGLEHRAGSSICGGLAGIALSGLLAWLVGYARPSALLGIGVVTLGAVLVAGFVRGVRRADAMIRATTTEFAAVGSTDGPMAPTRPLAGRARPTGDEIPGGPHTVRPEEITGTR